MKRMYQLGLLVLVIHAGAAWGAVWGTQGLIRWTGTEDIDGTTTHVIEVLNQKLGTSLKAENFVLQEDRDLAFNHYKRLAQVMDQVPIHGKSIRIWTELKSDRTVQVEADLEPVTPANPMMSILDSLGLKKSTWQLRQDLTSEQTALLVRNTIQTDSQDPHSQGTSWNDEWRHGNLYRSVKVRGKRGTHQILIDLDKKEVVEKTYREFPQRDGSGLLTKPNDSPSNPDIPGFSDSPGSGTLSIPVQIFPIYEEVASNGAVLQRVPGKLRNLRTQLPELIGDIYAPLRTQHYYDYNYNPALAETEAGRAKGFWSMSLLKDRATQIRNSLPLVPNTWSTGVLLEGRFATVNIHPDAIQRYTPLNFTPRSSSALFPTWLDVIVDGDRAQELIPSTAFSGKPLFSAAEAWNRPAQRLPDHDPRAYLNDGFDEIQVYYAIDTLFQELRSRGFLDPDLSTRPFNAFLFNPEISYRNNAYYTDDTINFTTYSPDAPNMARDNTTIWHELGHGVMDRLMGDQIELADTGGLSEGMADFIAALVVQGVTGGLPFPGSNEFRIINKTGFYLTNEVHDDGESYGGAMKDFLDAVIRANPENGLSQVTDVVLETMRLTRDYPGLTAPEWFKHLLFADSLGRPGLRQPGELRPFLLPALAGRNFKINGGTVASFTLVNAGSNEEVIPGNPGARETPISVLIPKDQMANFQLRASVKNSDEFSFKFPVEIRLQYKGGPLQGGIHWTGEEKGPQTFILNSEADTASIPLQISGTCDEVNRPNGRCVDYVYVQVWNHGETERPTAKKRFYLSVKNR